MNDEKHMRASWHVVLQRKDSRLQMNKTTSLVGTFSCHSWVNVPTSLKDESRMREEYEIC
jgi:hypothetical protein